MEPPEQDFFEQAESLTPGGGRGGCGGWRRAGAVALRQGWRVGKAAAVAGAAIAAAPAVVPALLILSTLGAALSLTFGAYLASFACTDRLMRSLLPPPPSQPPPVPQDDESESESEYEYELEGDGGDPEEFLEAAEQDKKPPEDVQPPLENENEEEKEEVKELEENKRVSSEEEKLLHAIESGAKAGEEAGLVETEAAAEFEEMDAEITEIEAHGNGGSTSVSVVSGVPQRREDIGAARKVFEEMIASSKEPEAGEEGAMAVGEKEVVGTVEPSGLVVVESLEVLGESEPPGFSSGYASAVEDQSSMDMADAESRSSVGHAGAFIAEGTIVVVETETAVPSDGEDFYDEEKLWEQLSAMRTIVGYKAARSLSLVEEMRAIYLFTGVEPPPISSREVSDLRELNRKLRFLKSVIGVK